MARVTTCSFHADNSWKEFPLIQTRNTHRHQPNPLQVANDATSGTLGGPRYQINGRHTVSQPLVLKILRSTGSLSSYMVSYPVNTVLLVRTRGIVMVEQTRDTSVCCLHYGHGQANLVASLPTEGILLQPYSPSYSTSSSYVIDDIHRTEYCSN